MSSSGSTSSSQGHKAFLGLLAGGITGASEICVTYPVEFVKIQLQLDKHVDKQRDRGVRDVIRQTFRTHGVLGFYRGLTVVMYGAIPKQAVRFAAFEELKRHFVDPNGNLSPTNRVVCGMGAGVCEAVFAVTPVESIKVKIINDQRLPVSQYKGIADGVVKIVKTYGILALYRGVTPTVLKSATNQGIRFYIVETLKDRYRKGDPTKPVGTLALASFGALAGFVSVLVNTPLDVVKTRMQGLQSQQYRSTLQCFCKITKEEGVLAFYKGVLPRLTRVCLEVSITFVVYDSLMDLFRQLKLH